MHCLSGPGEDETVLYAVGNAVRIHNIRSGHMRYVLGREGGGIGAVAVHPSRAYFAVAERGNVPAIYIYAYPSLEVLHVLLDGTERSFSDVGFSLSGEKLVSVGSFPDFLLTVWDWRNSRLVLRTKAFGQEVFNARFNPDDDGKLTTSGTGHIRFWRMALTFTGLKLQGAIGKFGRVDLSDIHAFAELPDGKVVSGCEGGWLLLWDGGLIKTQIGRLDAPPPEGSKQSDGPPASGGAHDAAVHVVKLDRELGVFVTGGDDGCVRIWDFRGIDTSDMLPDGVSIPGCFPLGEVNLGSRVKVRGIVKLNDIESGVETNETTSTTYTLRTVTWLVQDGAGSMHKFKATIKTSARGGESSGPLLGASVSFDLIESELIFQCHAGAVTGVATSPSASERFAASIGVDGSVRCWDLATDKLVLATRFSHNSIEGGKGSSSGHGEGGHGSSNSGHQLKGTSVAWAPSSVDPSGRTLAAGFSDGTVRFLFRGSDGWKRLSVLKPSSQAITAIAYSPNGKLLAVASKEGSIFFLGVGSKLADTDAGVTAASAPLEVSSSFIVHYTPLGFLAMHPVERPAANDADASARALPASSSNDPSPVNCINWSSDGTSLVAGVADGTIRVFTPPSDASSFPDTTETFDITTSGAVPTSFLLFLDLELKKAAPPPPVFENKDDDASSGGKKKKKKAADAEAEAAAQAKILAEWPTELVVPASSGAITAVIFSPLNPNRLYVGCSGDGGHMLHEISLPKTKLSPGSLAAKNARPLAMYPITPLLGGEFVRQPHVTQLSTTLSGKLLIIGTSGGSVFIRATSAPAAQLRLQLPDSEGGGVLSVATTADEKMLVVSGGDGSVGVVQLKGVDSIESALSSAISESIAASSTSYSPIDIREAVLVGISPEAAAAAEAEAERKRKEKEKEAAAKAAAAEAAAKAAEAGEAPPQAAAAPAPAVAPPSTEEKPSSGATSAPASADEAGDALRAAAAAAAAKALVKAKLPVSFLPELPQSMLLAITDASPSSTAIVEAPSTADEWLSAHEAEDILDPNTYSIQEDRLKSAEDARKRDAEEEKAKVRSVIASLRDSFTALREKAAKASAEHPMRGLTDEEMRLDPELEELLRAEGEERLLEVDRENAYERQKRRVALSKLVKTFLSNLETDIVSVSSISDPHGLSVSTVRLVAMPQALKESIEQARRELEGEANNAAADQAAIMAAAATEASDRATSAAAAAAATMAASSMSPVESVEPEKTLTTAEMAEQISFEHRRTLREGRRKALRQLEGKRPGPNDEDAADVAAVAWAKDHMGDYRLKTDKAYRVPEGVKLDAPSKKRQVLLLEGRLHDTRQVFNAKVMRMRTRKIAVIAAVKQAQSEIEEIEKELSSGLTAKILHSSKENLAALTASALSPNAPVPPKGFVVPDLSKALLPNEVNGWESLTDVCSRHLSNAAAELQWEKHLLETAGGSFTASNINTAPASIHIAARNSYTGHLSDFMLHLGDKYGALASHAALVLADSKKRPLETPLPALVTSIIKSHSLNAYALPLASSSRDAQSSAWRFNAARLHASSILPDPSNISNAPLLTVSVLPGFTASTAPSKEEVEAAVIVFKALTGRKAELSLLTFALIDAFDAGVAALKKERSAVQAMSSAASLRLSVLRQELSLLKDMEKRDAALDARLSKARADKAGIASAVAEFAAKLLERKGEVEELQGKEKRMLSEFNDTVGTSHSAYAQLLKIYKKKIKRARVLAPGQTAPEEEEDDDDDLEDLGDEDDDDDEEETCPDGCDKSLYDKVLKLRERRLDIVDAADLINKDMDEIRKASDRQSQRERQVDRDLASIVNEINVFAREKQGKLNVIDTWITLQASQILVGKQPSSNALTSSSSSSPAETTSKSASSGAAAATSDDASSANLHSVGDLPSTIDNCILFTKAGLKRLRGRTGELEIENGKLVSVLKDLQGEEKALQAEKKTVEARIKDVRAQVESIMVLKFGKVIDVDSLDKATTTSSEQLLLLNQEQEEFEGGANAELEIRRSKLTMLQEELTALTKQHTISLESAATLSARLEALEGELSGKVDTGLHAVALHATLGTPLATAVAQGKMGASSLSALAPVMTAATKRAQLFGSDPSNLPAAVTVGLKLSAKGGGPSSNDDSVAVKQEAAERARLAALVSHQAATLEGLRAQIAVLKTKSEAAAAEVFMKSTGSTSFADTLIGKSTMAGASSSSVLPHVRAPETGFEIAGNASFSARTAVPPVFASTVKKGKKKVSS